MLRDSWAKILDEGAAWRLYYFVCTYDIVEWNISNFVNSLDDSVWSEYTISPHLAFHDEAILLDGIEIGAAYSCDSNMRVLSDSPCKCCANSFIVSVNVIIIACSIILPPVPNTRISTGFLCILKSLILYLFGLKSIESL
jgi:hypothetical protein